MHLPDHETHIRPFRAPQALPSFGHSFMSINWVFGIVGSAVGTARFSWAVLARQEQYRRPAPVAA